MMTGFLASQGFKVSQKRVGRSLKRVDPLHHVWRQNTTRRLLNPVPYRAAYFGEKLHIDQNEKIIMYGVTHVCAVDGFSGKIVGFISMPVKSNSVIYDKLYRYVHCMEALLVLSVPSFSFGMQGYCSYIWIVGSSAC